MKCANCGADNRAGRKFCAQCAAPLSVNCPRCGASNEPGEKFCGECSAPLGASAAVGSGRKGTAEPQIRIADASAQERLEGERKTVTALFADIKGSMELMEDLDPEEARAIIDPALMLMIDAVRRYDGYVVQSTGDGIFALFGAPVAHEDHPQRALYAALRMQEEIRRFAERLRAARGLNLQVRVGVNVGNVVVRSIPTGEKQVEYTPIGHSISLASRLQTLANPGSIAISDGLRKLVEGYFTHKALGPARIKGSSEPVNVYEVLGLGQLRTRLQRAAGRGFTKFVGRQREMEALRHSAAMAREGRDQIVATVAEPGVGKSRLFYEFKATGASGWMVLEALSISHGKASAYLPVTDLLHNYFEISAADNERNRREKVAGKIAILALSLEDTLPYLFNLLGVVEGEDPLAQMDARVKKRRLLEAIKRILLRESLNQPLMVVFEDLHWMDGESEALLNLLAESLATSRVLLLVNYRPEYRHQWGSKTYYTQLRLDPLGRESAGEMLNSLLGTEADLIHLKRLIAKKTEGNPLFMEEIVLSLFEDGTLASNGQVKLARPLASLRIPPTVQGILASRIDRLPADEKDLLQTLAVIGTEFNLGLARAVSGKADDDLNRTLNNLQLAEFIYEQPAAGDVEYTFKHALTHDVAYSSLLSEHRTLLHERTGQAIEALYDERLEDHLTALAHHFERSGNARKAVEYLTRRGARAAQQGAHSEAIGCFTRALELLPRLPECGARDHQELDLQMALSWSAFIARGPRAPERKSALIRARELGERLGENVRLMQVLLVMAHERLCWNDLGPGQELAERVLAMGQGAETSAMLAVAHQLLGSAQFSAGQLCAAREHFEHAVELFGAGPADYYGAYFARNAPSILAVITLILGHTSTATRKFVEIEGAAQRETDPDSIANNLFRYCMRHLLLRDPSMVAERADELLSISIQHEIRAFLIAATFFRSWATAAGARGEEGIAEMRRSIEEAMDTGAGLWPALLFPMFVESCGKSRRVDEGLNWVDKGLTTAEQNGLRVVESELLRLKGELLMIKDPGNVLAAERCLRTAIEVARRQHAKLFELRATISLARLLQQQGKTDEARAMLAEIYKWFTEGFDTVDLKDAKVLLDELSS